MSSHQLLKKTIHCPVAVYVPLMPLYVSPQYNTLCMVFVVAADNWNSMCKTWRKKSNIISRVSAVYDRWTCDCVDSASRPSLLTVSAEHVMTASGECVLDVALLARHNGSLPYNG